MSAPPVRGLDIYRGRPTDDGVVDDVAIRRAAQGDRSVRLTARERRAAVADLRRWHSAAETARRLGLAERSVVRLTAQARAAS
jgi:hypothetical protein